MEMSSSVLGKEGVETFLAASLVTTAATDGSFEVCVDMPSVNEVTIRQGIRPNSTSENFSKATIAWTIPEKIFQFS